MSVSAGWDVDLVVPRPIVADKLNAFGEGLDELFVDAAGDFDAGEGAVQGDDAVEGARLALFDEIGAVGGLGSEK